MRFIRDRKVPAFLTNIDVQFRTRKGLKRLSLRINKEGKLSVSYPKHFPKYRLYQFLIDKELWILDSIHRAKQRREENRIAPGTSIHANGYTFKWETGTEELIKDGNQFLFKYPGTDSVFEVESEQLVKDFERELKKLAKAHFLELTNKVSSETGLIYEGFRISTAKTRWGSCSYNNKLSISCYAFLLSPDLQEHLIIHELCHTKVKNHGPEFKNLLKDLSSNALKKESELRSAQIPYFCTT